MLASRLFAHSRLAAIAFALLAALVCTVPSLMRPPAVAAQTPYTCPNGQIVYPSLGQACTGTTTGTGTYVCPNGQVVATGQVCPTTGTTTCPNGQVVAVGQVCPTTGYTTCANGQQVLVGQACPATTSTTTTGSCVGITLTAGESCSNGVVTCNGQPVAAGTTCTATISVANAAAALPQAQNVTCPGGGFVPVGQACPTASTATTSTLATAATAPTAGTAPPAGFARTLPAGWNIVAGPAGTTLPGVSGSLFTLQPGDTAYETIPAGTPLKAGAGYWVDLASTTSTAIATASPTSVTVQLPAGQFVMIGNAGNTVATVTGADSVLVYNPTTASYTQTNQLQPGQGAWAVSNAGGPATITNAPA
jgi:hypothetical protein